MEPYIVDYYNDHPYSVNVIEKMNDELEKVQKKYDKLNMIVNPTVNLHNLIMNSTRTDNDMAKLIFHLYGDKFKCTSIKKNEWYFYDDEMEKWRLSDDGIELRYLLNTEVSYIYKQKSDEYMSKYDENINFSEWFEGSDYYHGIEFLKYFLKLKKPAYKRRIMKECKDLFYEKDFIINNLNNIEDISKYVDYDPYGIIFNGLPL